MSGTPEITAPLHPIGVVARRTGIPDHVLRAWERRHQVVTPQRSDGGQRLYTDADVERLDVIGRLVQRGYRVGRLAELDDAQRIELLGVAGSGHGAAPDDAPAGTPSASLDEFKRAVQELDGRRLLALLERSSATLPPLAFMTELVSPLLRWVGDSWSEGTLGVAHEHLCSDVVGRLLSDRIEAAAGAAPGSVMVSATLPGERHYLGALLATLAAAAAGWRATWIGPDLPMHDLATACRQLDADAVAISLVAPRGGGPTDTVHDIAELRALLPGHVTLYVGGPATPPETSQAGWSSVVVPEDLDEFYRVLRPAAGSPETASQPAGRT